MITRETLKGCGMQMTAHMRGQGFSVSSHQCVEHPRLSRSVHTNKKTRTTTSKWFVDGVECADLDDAIRRLNETPAEQRNMGHG